MVDSREGFTATSEINSGLQMAEEKYKASHSALFNPSDRPVSQDNLLSVLNTGLEYLASQTDYIKGSGTNSNRAEVKDIENETVYWKSARDYLSVPDGLERKGTKFAVEYVMTKLADQAIDEAAEVAEGIKQERINESNRQFKEAKKTRHSIPHYPKGLNYFKPVLHGYEKVALEMADAEGLFPYMQDEITGKIEGRRRAEEAAAIHREQRLRRIEQVLEFAKNC